MTIEILIEANPKSKYKIRDQSTRQHGSARLCIPWIAEEECLSVGRLLSARLHSRLNLRLYSLFHIVNPTRASMTE